jgi:hypothetical protein
MLRGVGVRCKRLHDSMPGLMYCKRSGENDPLLCAGYGLTFTLNPINSRNSISAYLAAGGPFSGPDEWLGGLVVCRDESIDVLLQLLDGSEGGAVE